MTNRLDLLTNFQQIKGDDVVFANGATREISGVGDIALSGLSIIKDVFYVEELKPNILSISQLFDQNMKVKFYNLECFLL